ncbi:hypothetical protein MATR_11500 [Marivirga tractuosa]|nr:hypothetical protein MATR_11500 [Marivirga tractuosa]
MEKYLSNNLHTTGKYFQKRKEKKNKKKKRESFSFRGNCFGGKSFLKNTSAGERRRFFKKPKGLGLAAEKQFIPNLLSSFI